MFRETYEFHTLRLISYISRLVSWVLNKVEIKWFHFCPGQCGSGGWSTVQQTEESGFNFWFGPWTGRVWEATYQCFSLTWMLCSLSLFLPSPLSKINKHVLRWRKKMLIFSPPSVTKLIGMTLLGLMLIYLAVNLSHFAIRRYCLIWVILCRSSLRGWPTEQMSRLQI